MMNSNGNTSSTRKKRTVGPPPQLLPELPHQRLERLRRELKCRTLALQATARDFRQRCDSPAAAAALAERLERDGGDSRLVHALKMYQAALARLKAEVDR